MAAGDFGIKVKHSLHSNHSNQKLNHNSRQGACSYTNALPTVQSISIPIRMWQKFW